MRCHRLQRFTPNWNLILFPLASRLTRAARHATAERDLEFLFPVTLSDSLLGLNRENAKACHRQAIMYDDELNYAKKKRAEEDVWTVRFIYSSFEPPGHRHRSSLLSPRYRSGVFSSTHNKSTWMQIFTLIWLSKEATKRVKDTRRISLGAFVGDPCRLTRFCSLKKSFELKLNLNWVEFESFPKALKSNELWGDFQSFQISNTFRFQRKASYRDGTF